MSSLMDGRAGGVSGGGEGGHMAALSLLDMSAKIGALPG